MNVFESFLPQLLLYPNPTDPLNGEAAALLMKEPDAYAAKIKGALPALAAPHLPINRCRARADYVQRYAQPEHIAENGHSNGHGQGQGDDDEDMSKDGSADGFLSSSEEDETPVTGAADL